MDSPKRRTPSHTPLHQAFNSPVIIFLTVCTKMKSRIKTSMLHDKEKADNTLKVPWPISLRVSQQLGGSGFNHSHLPPIYENSAFFS
jgi:hypothetical protein